MGKCVEWDEEPECATDSTPGSRLTVSAEAPSVAQPKPLSRNTLRAGHGGQQTAGRKIEQHDSALGISIQVTPGLIVGGMLRPSDSLHSTEQLSFMLQKRHLYFILASLNFLVYLYYFFSSH